jgi:hypothetical protein
MRALWTTLSGVVTRHPGRLLAVVAAVVASLTLGLPLLEFQTGQDTMVDPGADVYAPMSATRPPSAGSRCSSC